MDATSAAVPTVELDLAQVLVLLLHFLLEQRYIGALRALEQESGRVLSEGNEVKPSE